jgi:hypothetical protein
VNTTSPAIVAQHAVRRLPRWALWLFSISYLLPGVFGRDPWKSVDITSFGFMQSMAQGESSWLHPTLNGLLPELDGPMAYWLGALFIHWSPNISTASWLVRIPFLILAALSLWATWHATYQLAKNPAAQPVAFAFGGEAKPNDYSRTIADAGLLALIACLGLAQASHEITPMVFQLTAVSMMFAGISSIASTKYMRALALILLSQCMLTLGGAPTLALLLGLLAAAWSASASSNSPAVRQTTSTVLLVACVVLVILAWQLDLWRWRIRPTPETWIEIKNLARLLIWFTWPVWPLTFWTIWRWRSVWRSPLINRHIGIPLSLFILLIISALITDVTERTLLLALPVMASMAAFALPTLRRSVSSLIDWFTLVFFSGCGLIMWIIWLATLTNWPAQPAANVRKLLPGFQGYFHSISFTVALLASLAWIALVYWRAGRHRSALWKSLVLPASGASLCWLLLMTLWLPMLDYARSYRALVSNVEAIMGHPACSYIKDLSAAQTAAFRFHAQMKILPLQNQTSCNWLVVNPESVAEFENQPEFSHWQKVQTVRRPADKNEDLILFHNSSVKQ